MFRFFGKQSTLVIKQIPNGMLKSPKELPKGEKHITSTASTNLNKPTMEVVAEEALKRLFLTAMRTFAGFTYNQVMKDFCRMEGPKRYTMLSWKPVFHYQEFDENKHLLICFLPGLTPKDVWLVYEEGIVEVQGSKKGELWINDESIYYNGSFKFPKKVKEEESVVFFIRMEHGVLKLLIDKDREGGVGPYKKRDEVGGAEEFVLGDFPGIVF